MKRKERSKGRENLNNNEKKPFYKKKWFIIVVALVIIVAIFSPKNENESKKNSNNAGINTNDISEEKANAPEEPEEPEKPEEEYAITEDMTDEEKIENIIKKVNGNGYESFDITKDENGNVDNIQLVKYFEYGSDENGLKYNQNPNVVEVLRLLKENNITYDSYEHDIYTNFLDKYGNEKRDILMQVIVTKEEADKINYDNFNTDNLKEVSDYYFIHASAKKSN